MKCAWKELLSILPPWLAQEIHDDSGVQELRLRLEAPPELKTAGKDYFLTRPVSREDISFCVNAASRYSPWAAQTAAHGYLTAPGGHRIGICGEAVTAGGTMTGIRSVTSLCIRVARDFPGIGAEAAKLDGSILLIGSPGSGKTTLLRDIVRKLSAQEAVAVVDERGEIFPGQFFDNGQRVDVLSGCPKTQGIDTVLRTMSPAAIAVDEITAESDCRALMKAGWCGVRLLATAHAASIQDLYSRTLYRPLLESRLFSHVLVLRQDKSWREERMVR